jgi:hypothetical protein
MKPQVGEIWYRVTAAGAQYYLTVSKCETQLWKEKHVMYDFINLFTGEAVNGWLWGAGNGWYKHF